MEYVIKYVFCCKNTQNNEILVLNIGIVPEKQLIRYYYEVY